MENQTLENQFDNNNSDYKPWGMEVNAFCMLMHLSQLTSVIIPLAGLVLPIIMWASNKDQSPKVDIQGKNIFNWLITSLIIVVICMVLMMVYIGAFLLMAFGIASLIFAIMGAIKSNNGELYKYPFAIEFIK